MDVAGDGPEGDELALVADGGLLGRHVPKVSQGVEDVPVDHVADSPPLHLDELGVQGRVVPPGNGLRAGSGKPWPVEDHPSGGAVEVTGDKASLRNHPGGVGGEVAVPQESLPHPVEHPDVREGVNAGASPVGFAHGLAEPAYGVRKLLVAAFPDRRPGLQVDEDGLEGHPLLADGLFLPCLLAGGCRFLHIFRRSGGILFFYLQFSTFTLFDRIDSSVSPIAPCAQ